MPLPLSYEKINQAVTQVSPMIHHLAHELWQHSELSLVEVKSAQMSIDTLRGEGFVITSKGTAQVPTAFIAEWGSGSPVIVGLLAEYDALPGLGNEPVPYKEPRKDQTTSGHGCGHNLLCAGTIGAAIALKNLMTQENITGTLRVYGCPAEEAEGAKAYMAREGLFDDLDVALCWHPGSIGQVSYIRSLAVNKMIVEFLGKEAHAGALPWQGRSAVHAAELFAHGLNLMREHLQPAARLHYIYEQAGEAPNIVPNYARLRLYIRDDDHERVMASTAWIKQIAQGAALATQTKDHTLVYIGNHDLLLNTSLAVRMQYHLEQIGVPTYDEEEITFAHEIQRNAGVAPQGMATTINPLPSESYCSGASTDVGDVSWCAPTMGCSMPTVPLEISLHTWAATATHGMSIGFKGAIYAAKALVATGIDILTDAQLRQDIRADFQKRTGGKPYVSLLPSEIKHPIGLPEWMLKTTVLK